MTKRLVYSLLIMTAASTLITYAYLWDNASQKKEQEIDKNIAIAKLTAVHVRRDITERIRRNSSIALTETTLNSRTLKHHLVDSFEQLFVVDTEGRVMESSLDFKGPKAPVLPKDRFFRTALSGKTSVTDLVASPISGNNVVMILIPIKQGGKVVGVLANQLPTNYFSEYLTTVQIGKTGNLSLLDSQGYYIYGKGQQSERELIFAPCYIVERDKPLSVSERTSSRTGKKTVFTKVRLEQPNWYVVASQQSAELDTPPAFVALRIIITLILLASILFGLQKYKTSIEKHERLVKRQNSDKLALIGELAAGMAHEIRNPLTTIKGFTELLKERKSSSDSREILDIISTSVDHIDEIVTETLLLARPQKMHVTDIDLGKLIEQVYSFMINEALLQDINLDYTQTGQPVVVKGDVTHLKQLLINLIKNAFEATPPKGWVTISVERQQRTVRVLVKDSGVGIAEEDLKKIGTPFFTTKPDGTGLGLSVCLRIAHEHGGNLKFKSTPGQGTSAMLELPANSKSQL
ncbi:MAG TPA: sensor histidine kinase [Bacillota bacterium]|nr:sensor histidine kinase [Bacillota bacterium]